MKLKINKACDLSSISVLPPHTRRSNSVSSGLDSSSIFGTGKMPSQIQSQQQQLSQPTVSSQPGFLSQFSQNSQDEILTNEKFGSQERDLPARRASFLPRISYARDEGQMVVSRPSSSLMRKLSSQEYKCEVSEELDRRIGMVETSISRLGVVLDSVQSDIIQVHRSTKEIEQRVIIDSDEEIDGGFSCLLKEKETVGYSIEEAEKETARILRKARRRKRKYCNTIIIN
ncbi:hypothetical protein M569_14331 [Genlisea aurea]|uniref:Uncharacterized protein n=1 Tax=Genlisea aurea TaxID=192259 RepID=S8C7W8_9LAMI|nr:hypothetical protein M569_14331 [Genlisea aurea]